MLYNTLSTLCYRAEVFYDIVTVRRKPINNHSKDYMETATLIGLAVIYFWIHGAIIVVKKVQDTTQYENVILIGAAVSFLIFVISMLAGSL